MRFIWILVIICFLIVLENYSTQGTNNFHEITNISTFFCPRDNCNDVFTEFFEDSKESLYCSFFDFDLFDEMKITKEVDSILVIDSINLDLKKYKNGDYPFRGIVIENKTKYMHNKFCVSDGKSVLTGSTNPTYNGVNRNNNNLVIIESEYIAKIYSNKFFNLVREYNSSKDIKAFDGIESFDNSEFSVYFCPEDNCRNVIKSLINISTNSIDFMTFSFTDGGIASDLVLKHYNGVEIKGIFEKKKNAYSVFNLLNQSGINVRVDTNPYTMHHKVFIFDNNTVALGSYNPTKNGNEKNDENLVVIKNQNLAQTYLQEFNYLWENVTMSE